MDAMRRVAGNVRSFLTSSYFDDRYKTKVHMGQLLLIILVISLTIARIATKPKEMPTSRADTIGIIMVG